MLTTGAGLPARLAGREHEVLHVLHHLEAQSDHGAVHQSVHHAVELAACHQIDDDQAGPLVQLLVDGSHDSSPPRVDAARQA